MRANSRTASASTRAPRRSAISRSIPAPTCTSRPGSPTTRRSTCRRCRPTPISACISTAKGPSGIIRDLPADQTAYYRFLPMIYPYLIKQAPDTFVVQFGGGISTSVALRSKSRSVTVAEGNPAVLHAFRTDKGLRDFTGDVLNNPKVRVIDYDGRLYLAYTKDRYDIIDLSLANSAGLSSPGGFAIVEKFSYTREAMTELHARAQGRRHPLGHAVEQGGAAEIGAQALRHHGGGGARGRRRRHRQSLLRRVDLPVDRDRALQARRLQRRGDRQAARAHARHVVRRDLLSGLRIRSEPDRGRARRTTGPGLLRRAMARRQRAPGRARRHAAARRRSPATRSRRRPRSPPHRPFRRPPWASWPGTTWCTAAGTISRTATSSTRAC